MRGAFVDPGGDLPLLQAAARDLGVVVERLLVTHGHIDHCGGAARLALDLGLPIEGPHEADRFLLERLDSDGRAHGMDCRRFVPDRWLRDGDTVQIGDLVLDVLHCPGHTPGHVVFHHAPSRLALVGDVLFEGSIGRTDLPRGSLPDLICAITGKLWPLGRDTAFISGHGPMSHLRPRAAAQSVRRGCGTRLTVGVALPVCRETSPKPPSALGGAQSVDVPST